MRSLSLAAVLASLTVGCAGAQVADTRPALAVADLNGVAGKVFDLNVDDGSFRFLKQDVPIDDHGKPGPAWFAAFVTQDTEYLQKEDRRNLAGLTDPVIAVFTGFDEANAKALRAGETWRADHMVLRPDLKEATGLSEDGQTFVALFTPRVANFSRDGTVKMNGKQVSAGVKGGGVRIAIQAYRTAEDLNKHPYRATLTGQMKAGRFVVSKMLLQPLPSQADADPKLPRVLSVGDSISMNYEAAARENLKAVANYHRIEDNCWSTARCRSFIRYWMGDYTKPGKGWDVILFNSGLHDMKQKVLRGPYAMPIDDYKKNLRIWIEQMKPTGATLVFVTTTPVPNDSGNARYAFRSKGAEDEFNDAAKEVLADYPEVLLCDLAAFIDNSPQFDNWRNGREVHFWKAEEQALVGKHIAESVTKAIEVHRKRQGK